MDFAGFISPESNRIGESPSEVQHELFVFEINRFGKPV